MMTLRESPRFGAALSLESLIEAALAEDLGPGDVTCEWTVPSGAGGEAVIVSKAKGVVAGVEAAAAVFRRFDPDLQVITNRDDGDTVEPGDLVLTVSGSLASILGAERTALNFLGRLSGIATAARRFTDAIAGTGCRVLDTRKTTPGWRALEKAAAAAGGAVNHRAGLFDMVLIKENHIRAAGGIRAALEGAIAPAREAGIEVEIEVTGHDEFEQALAGNDGGDRPDRILLDNMTVEELDRCVRTVSDAPGPRPRLEASGGVTLTKVRRIAKTGVDFISAGAITHSAPALDLSLQVRQA
ncbi:MAG: carboxylating nicotinate-nucleotide diphosphorylase [marine benthic group bacterium]|nr:carboxylating nicotinate-nucleotide diphosphorylase [Gemmatimonadota bacterium]